MSIESKQLTMKDFKAHPTRAYYQYVELHNLWQMYQESPEKKIMDSIKEIIRKEGCNCSCHECACI